MTTSQDGFVQKKRVYLAPEAILRYPITEDDALNTLIMCKAGEVDLSTSDRDVYEALGSIKPYDTFKLNKLTKLFEGVEVFKGRKVVLTEARVDALRKLALTQQNKQYMGDR